MSDKCPVCGNPGTIYYAKVNAKGGKAYYYKYVKHSDAVRKGEIMQWTCKAGSTDEAEYNARSKRSQGPQPLTREDLLARLKVDLHADKLGNYYYKDKWIGKSIPKSKVIEIVSDLLGVRESEAEA